MFKSLFTLLVFALMLTACAGVKKDNPDAINDALVGFTTCAQSARWSEALQYVTPSEVSQISDGVTFKPEYQKAAARMPLSTMRRMQWTVDREGRLVGMKEVLDQANTRYLVSEEQAKVGTNLEEMEKARIQRRLEEGRKILEEEENAEEPEVEVMTNRLTDEEKRKYGSTGELLAPEQYEDPNTDAAKEAMGTADESTEVPAEEEGYYGE
ncbi:MAG: hypothetical protein J6A06_04930 [Fibrobacteraceae bacterium]|nr:hypothetical protein [Fibrobacteraceae bacterium]